VSDGILLFGGSRETGLEVAKILAARGEVVTAFVRPTRPRRLKAPMCSLLWRCHDPESVAAAGNASGP
jgi:NAD(P)-dependent dehydrogenase (short-subunit alcohol dehydrogenase family)